MQQLQSKHLLGCVGVLTIPAGARPFEMSDICTDERLTVSLRSHSAHRLGAVVQVPCATLLIQHGGDELPRPLPPYKMLHGTVCCHGEQMGPTSQSWTPWKNLY